MTNKKHVTVIGGTSLDTIIQLYSGLKSGPQTTWAKDSYTAIGGTGAGKALNLAKLNIQVTIHTCVADDQAGKSICEALTHEGIELLIHKGEQASEQHTNIMSPSGERLSIYTHPPENPEDIDLARIDQVLAQTDIAAISILDYTRPTLALAKHHGKPLWIDLHDYDGKTPYHQDFLEAADVLFLSSDNLPHYLEFMQQQIDNGKSLVVVTHGKEGATAMDSSGEVYKQAIFDNYSLVDSNGAGDAFFSGFLAAFLQNNSIQQCMLVATHVAGQCVTSKKLYSETLTPDVLENA